MTADVAALAGALSTPDREFLCSLLRGARRPVPTDWLDFRLGTERIGCLAPHRIAPALAVLPGSQVSGHALMWPVQSLPAAQRSAMIQQAAERLRDLGLISGWRDEAYRCEAGVDDPLHAQGDELFRLERAAFRFFGLRSRAVHINGFADGGLWCGRRALSKATDPGLLDNLAAGGVPAGEAFEACAMRELGEEAGVPLALAAAILPAGAVRCTRVEAEGLHDEVLHLYNLALPSGFQPRNRDGEVAEFLHFSAVALMERLKTGGFTGDAAVVMACALLEVTLEVTLEPGRERAESSHGEH